MRHPFPLLALLFVASAAVARMATVPSPARAALAEHLSIDDLVARTHTCLEGTVLEARARRAPDGLVETAYRLRVDDRPIGAGGDFETVVLPGGVLPDGSGLAIPGLGRLAVGERVLLFLTAADGVTGRRMPIGLEQGRYRIVSGPGGRPLAMGALALGDEAAAERGHRLAVEYAELRAQLAAAIQRRTHGEER